MTINPQLKDIFKQFNIDYTEGLLYLTAIYYNLPLTPTLTEALDTTIKQVNLSHIVERDYTKKEIKWNISLFSGQETQWEWVDKEYRKLFKDLRPDKGGSSISCLKRMKDYFRDNPEVRKDEVIAAVKLYLSELSDPAYLQQADYFIKKGTGADMTSRLQQYLERVRLKNEVEMRKNDKLMGSSQ